MAEKIPEGVTVVLVESGRQIDYKGPRYSRRKVTIDRLWHVIFEGEVIGGIRYVMMTHEQRTPGRMYVNKRWESPGWSFMTGKPTGLHDLKFSHYSPYSKTNAVIRIFNDHKRSNHA